MIKYSTTFILPFKKEEAQLTNAYIFNVDAEGEAEKISEKYHQRIHFTYSFICVCEYKKLRALFTETIRIRTMALRARAINKGKNNEGKCNEGRFNEGKGI